MPPLTARELGRWERRFTRSLEDLELLHASDGQLARRETKVRQARVRKQKKTRPCSTPKHSIGKSNDARAAYANDRAQLLEVLASDCGCALHAEGCYHALLERHGMSVLNDIVHWRSRSLCGRESARTCLKAIVEGLRTDADEFVPRFPPIQSGMEICASAFYALTMVPSSNLSRELTAKPTQFLLAAMAR